MIGAVVAQVQAATDSISGVDLFELGIEIEFFVFIFVDVGKDVVDWTVDVEGEVRIRSVRIVIDPLVDGA